LAWIGLLACVLAAGPLQQVARAAVVDDLLARMEHLLADIDHSILIERTDINQLEQQKDAAASEAHRQELDTLIGEMILQVRDLDTKQTSLRDQIAQIRRQRAVLSDDHAAMR
jgi:hypothetical protein